jgi:hypothetical protein
VATELYVDMPRRIGNLGYDPEGLLVQFRGQPGAAFYDVPYATIRHGNDEASFVAAQRFAALAGEAGSFGVIALGGNQSFRLAASQGIIAVNLGASTQGRPDTRPECIILPDGTAEHRIISGGDPFLGSYAHRFALVFPASEDASAQTTGRSMTPQAEVALAARRLRTCVPLIRVQPGGGDWPAERTLLAISPDTVHVTAFRATKHGTEIVVNDLSGEPSMASVAGATPGSASLPPYGIATL